MGVVHKYYGMLTEVKGFTYFSTIVSEDSDCVICVIKDVESVTCVDGRNIVIV